MQKDEKRGARNCGTGIFNYEHLLLCESVHLTLETEVREMSNCLQALGFIRAKKLEWKFWWDLMLGDCRMGESGLASVPFLTVGVGMA